MMKFFTQMCCVVAVIGVSNNAQAAVFNPETVTLDNGLQIVVLPNHRAPVVLHMVWYKAGSVDEPVGKSGVAHLLEHLMFKGTKKNPDGAFSRKLAQHGGQENAFTTLDYTGYYQTVASNHLEMVMALEADRMTNLILDPKDVATERAVVLEERNMRIENNPGARLNVLSNQKLYPKGHPYGRPIIGWRKELAALTREDALAFYHANYAPSNAVLVVAGDVNVYEVIALAKKYYGSISMPRAAQRKNLISNAPIKGGETVLVDARVRQPMWSETVLQPSLTNGTPKRTAALEVLSEILGSGSTSRLYRKLVIETAQAVSAGTYYDSGARGEGHFSFYASPRPGVKIDVLTKALHDEVKRMVAQGLQPGELDRVRTRMISSAVFARDEMKTGAWALGGALASNHHISDVEDWPDRIANVTEQDVLEALKAVLSEPRRVTSKLLPETAKKGQGS